MRAALRASASGQARSCRSGALQTGNSADDCLAPGGTDSQLPSEALDWRSCGSSEASAPRAALSLEAQPPVADGQTSGSLPKRRSRRAYPTATRAALWHAPGARTGRELQLRLSHDTTTQPIRGAASYLTAAGSDARPVRARARAAAPAQTRRRRLAANPQGPAQSGWRPRAREHSGRLLLRRRHQAGSHSSGAAASRAERPLCAAAATVAARRTARGPALARRQTLAAPSRGFRHAAHLWQVGAQQRRAVRN